ncbi:MAG: hypothetical protein JXB49_28190 [Bacteroidales bacterium]|nr:hypothetical protein [Bacteroidales bacterium]
MKTRYILIILLALTFSSANTQTSSDIFPDLEGWNKPDDPETYYSYNLWDLIDGAADSYLYYGFEELQTGDYKKGDDKLIRVDIFQHKDILNAYGIYSLERSPEMNFIPVGAEGYSYEGILNFFVDQFYIKLSTHNREEEVDKAMRDLANLFILKLSPNPGLPKILSCFPEENQRQHSKLYSPESYLGLEFLKSVFTAEYQYNDSVGFVVFISAPGSKNEVLNMISKYKAFCKYEGSIDEGKIIELNDPYNGLIYLAYKGPYMVGTVYLNDNDKAKKYINQTIDNCMKLEAESGGK